MRRSRLQRLIHRYLKIILDLLLQFIDSRFVEYALANQKHLHARDGVARRVALPFDIRTIETFVIRQRMRIRPDYVEVDESRAMTGTAIVDCLLQCGVADDRVGAINFVKMEIREASHEARDVASGGLHLNRDGNRVLVIFHAEQDRKLAV